MAACYLELSGQLFSHLKQARSIGATVINGEKPHLVVFWKTPETSNGQNDGSEKPKARPMLRYYWVFNIDQCTGIPEHLIFPIIKPAMPFDACEDIIKGMPKRPPIKHQKSQAFYEPEGITSTCRS